MARHAAPSNGRRRWIVTSAVVAGAAIAAVLLLTLPGGARPAAETGPRATPSASASASHPACPASPRLRVAAASGIAPVVRAVAAGVCVDLSLTVDDSAKAAAALERGDVDVWIPDSRARAILVSAQAAATAPSVAVSPVVIAANDGLDTARFTGKNALSWGSLLAQGTIAPLKVQVQSTATSSTSLVLAAGLNAVAQQSSGDRYTALATTAVAAATITSSGAPADAAVPSSTLRVEEARLAAVQPDTKILDMAGGYPQLDYPWVVAGGASASARDGASVLLSALQGSAGDTARAQQKLLNPGALAVEPGSYPGARSGMLLPAPTAQQIPTLYAVADAGAQHGNILSVLDVSGSMAENAGEGNETKMQAVQNSAELAMQLLSPQSRVGLWEFASQLDPPNDYLKVLPVRALADSRDQLIGALNSVQVRPTGGTSLYRTVLDAYKTLQATWQPGYANSLLVFTDGKDEDDPAGISLASLQTQLKALADPKRPIQVIMLGYGQADISAMTAITSTVDGVVYHISTPSQLVGAFIDAISQSVVRSLVSS